MASSASTPSRSSADKEKDYAADEPHVQVDHVYAEEHPEAYYVEKYGSLGPIFQKLFSSGVEARGVQRVPEDERTAKNTWNKCVLFDYRPLVMILTHKNAACSCGGKQKESDKIIQKIQALNRSVNTVLTTIPIGVLAQEFYTLTLPYVQF